MLERDLPEPKVFNCETCGKETKYGNTGRCNNCWEVERRIHDYLRTKNGLKVILGVVEEMFGEQLRQVIDVGPPGVDPFITQ